MKYKRIVNYLMTKEIVKDPFYPENDSIGDKVKRIPSWNELTVHEYLLKYKDNIRHVWIESNKHKKTSYREAIYWEVDFWMTDAYIWKMAMGE